MHRCGKFSPDNKTICLTIKKIRILYPNLFILIMGRDPVELAKRAKYKPPAMRVPGVCYTKKSPFRYNEVVQAKQIAKGR